jgi:hypothetical protein
MDQDYRGEALYHFQGQVQAFSGSFSEHEFRVSLFWSPSGQTKIPANELVEQASASVAVHFPSSFEINVFYPPDQEVWINDGPMYAMALILVYEDLDDNREYTLGGAQDELRGGAADWVLFYAPEAIDSTLSPTGLDLAKGFSLVQIPINCRGTTYQIGTQDCGIPLGNACQTDLQCGPNGICLKRVDQTEFFNGYCAGIVDPNGCDPIGAVVVSRPVQLWLEQCELGTDCKQAICSCRPIGPQGFSFCSVCLPFGYFPTAFMQCKDGNPTPMMGCGEHLGESCIQDRDCQDLFDPGMCLSEYFNHSFTNGYCTVKNRSCKPLNGVMVSFPTDLWYKSCDADSKCRTNDGYFCNPYYQACFPRAPVSLSIFSGFRPEVEMLNVCVELWPE